MTRPITYCKFVCRDANHVKDLTYFSLNMQEGSKQAFIKGLYKNSRLNSYENIFIQHIRNANEPHEPVWGARM